VQFERRTVASARARHLRPDSDEVRQKRMERRGWVIQLWSRVNRVNGRLCQEDAQASCRTRDEGKPFGAVL
jgi:hypothetical protein